MGDELVLGIDVGGTKTLAVLVRPDAPGGPEVLATELSPSGAGDPAVVDGIVDAASRLAARAAEGGGRVVGAGVGLAGFVDPEGVVRAAPNAAGLVDRDVRGVLSGALGVPVVVDNDANCAAVAAHALLAPDARHLVAVTFGTGIGGGLVVDGRLVRGGHGFAGEPGHMVVDPHGPLCPCGQRGCWERYASGSGLGALAREAVTAGRAPALAALASDPADPVEVRGEDVGRLVAAGDPGAIEVLDAYAGWVALGVANLVLLLDPEVVVLGGGVITLGEELLGRVRRLLPERFPAAAAHRRVRIEGSPGGPESGALGAALIATGVDR